MSGPVWVLVGESWDGWRAYERSVYGLFASGEQVMEYFRALGLDDYYIGGSVESKRLTATYYHRTHSTHNAQFEAWPMPVLEGAEAIAEAVNGLANTAEPRPQKEQPA